MRSSSSLLSLALGVCLFSSVSASAQTATIDTFGSFAVNAFSPFNGSFNGGDPAMDQFLQQPGFISITPVNGGNPFGDGSFDAGVASPGDFSSFNFFQLTARIDPGNANTSFTVQLRDSSFASVAIGTFSTSLFGQSFSTASVPLVLTGVGNIADVRFFTLLGDSLPANAFRASFDQLQANVVPEPASVVLLGLGAALVLRRSRRSLL